MMQILERLRLAREEHGLDIDALARRTRLRTHLLEAVEQGRWDDLPRGVYARAVVRAYAEAVGMDPHRVVTEVASLLPAPEDPLDGMARVRGFERRPAAADPQPDCNRGAGAPGADGMAVQARFAAAAAIDGAVLAALTLPMMAATAALSGVPVTAVVDVAAPAIGLLAALVATLYFFLLGAIGGATPGERLAGPSAARGMFRGTAEMALRRTGALVLRESSIVVAVLLPWPSAAREGGTPAAVHSGTPWEGRVPAR